jgi:hypothetical protein
VRLTALWGEQPADGRPRMCASGTRFYRPAETIFDMGPSHCGRPQLFSSAHVEEVVPLAAVVRTVAVQCAGAGAAQSPAALMPAAGAGGAGAPAAAACVYVCAFHYDHVGMVLGVGPPSAVAL